MKICVFSGSGLDADSGIKTFRGLKNSMWNNYKIEEVASLDGWRLDRTKVLDFYNERRRELPSVFPNKAHHSLVELEQHFDVVHITQNVSDLLERAGATDVIHLHGELTKARGSFYTGTPNWLDKTIDIGYNDINIGDKCPISDSQLRPNIVWFGEYPFNVEEAYSAVYNADILLIIGTSLQIGYTLNLLNNVKKYPKAALVYYIDPNPTHYLDNYNLKIEYIKKSAVDGVPLITELLLNQLNEE